MPDERIVFNGVNAATGDYGLPPMTPEELAQFIAHQAPPENLDEIRRRHEQESERALGIMGGVDGTDLAQAGWGVIFSSDADAAIIDALQPLLDWRKEQAGDLFRIYKGADGLRPNEGKFSFQMRHRVGFGVADPEQMPYYLLLVGDPEAIPFQFQFEMDLERAVGRIYFENVADYAAYAERVVAYEKTQQLRAKKMVFFSTDHDAATRLATEALVKPLVDDLTGYLHRAAPDWEMAAHIGQEAKKSRLTEILLDSDARPDLFFSATHGLEFPAGHPQQKRHQGALLCQDWPGPGAWRQPIPQDFFFSGDDIPSDAHLDNLIAFFFACFGNGTPQIDHFYKWAFKDQGAQIAPAPFLAHLPMRMLRQGALAVMGHVDRAFSFSFRWMGTTFQQTTTFESVLKRLLAGNPVGLAFEDFDSLFSEYTVNLTRYLEQIELGNPVDAVLLAGFWTASNDARNYIILGDPAVRL